MMIRLADLAVGETAARVEGLVAEGVAELDFVAYLSTSMLGDRSLLVLNRCDRCFSSDYY